MKNLLIISLVLCILELTNCQQKGQIISTFGEDMYEILLERVDRYILPLMPFWYEELDPYIDDPTLTAHHMGEHNVYKSYMNMFLKEWRDEEPENAFAKESILTIMMNFQKVPDKYQQRLRFHGGGFVNHCFYFGTLSPNEEKDPRKPTGEILKDIEDAFGSYDDFITQFNDKVKAQMGPGYVWLTRAPGAPKPNLAIQSTNSEDTPLLAGLNPILGIDLWEHAYFLKHNYKRWDYVKDFWMVVDWEYVDKLDKFWNNLEEEQRKADERVGKVVEALEKQKTMEGDEKKPKGKGNNDKKAEL